MFKTLIFLLFFFVLLLLGLKIIKFLMEKTLTVETCKWLYEKGNHLDFVGCLLILNDEDLEKILKQGELNVVKEF